MTGAPKPKDIVTFEELTLSNVWKLDAPHCRPGTKRRHPEAMGRVESFSSQPMRINPARVYGSIMRTT
jgi:hypothetical protein